MEIEANGAISFARFMELALYSPGEGYYERPRFIGSGGDFYTSASVGTLFGELLAFQFAQWFSAADHDPGTLQLVEAGAHDGKLAADILHWFRTSLPEIYSRMEYWIVEPSVVRRASQTGKLKEFGNVRWTPNLAGLSENNAPAYRIIFSNELLDAMPTHCVKWDANSKNWFEWGVGLENEEFVWKKLPDFQRSEISFPTLAPELAEVLFHQFSTEICPAAVRWWTEAARHLERGKIVAFDYGLCAEEFFLPERSHGTLRAFYKHHAHSELLQRPGEQDLTAHVNFSEIKSAGERAGLITETMDSQAKFLTDASKQTWSVPEKFGEWNPARRRQFQTLTHPEHLGRAFRVLVQSR
ncbi:MAG: SAM-dependent methyltransferase [Verrucomicrobiota bacterium]